MAFDLVRLGVISSIDRPFLVGATGTTPLNPGGKVDEPPYITGYIPHEDLDFNGNTNLELASVIDISTADKSVKFGANDTYKFIGQSFWGDSAVIFGACLLFDLTLSGNPSTGYTDPILYLYAHSGTFGSTGVPTGSPLATSNYLSYTYLDSTSLYAYIAFTFDVPYKTTSDAKYFIVAEFPTAISTESTRVMVNTINVPDLIGNAALKTSTTWSAQSTFELCYELYGKYESQFDGMDGALGDQYNHLATTENRGIAQCINGTSNQITKVGFWAKKTGAPTGTMVSKVYAMTGTFGTNGRPTGTALATSDTFNVTTLPTGTESYFEITYSGANQITLNSGTNYCISFEYTGGSSSNQVDMVVLIAGTGSEHPGNASYWNGTTWATTTYGSLGSSGTHDDLCFTAFGY